MVEPRLSTQWFVKMDQLAKNAIANQDTEDKVEFYPPRFNDTFLQWMENVHDWVISVSSGGVTKSLHGTMLRVKCTLAKKRQKVTDGNKMKMSWILGLVLPFGHSQLWAGRMSTQKTSNVTSQRQPW